MNRFFRLAENGSSFRQEVIAGLTTFSTIAYIIFVNPSVLSQTGMDFQSVMIATCLAGAIGTLLTGLLSNYPFAQAPGMGLNAFFTYTVVLQAGYTWQLGLGIVFISGIIFILLTLSGWREAIVDAFPPAILHAIPAGIGLFITLIGLNNAQIIDINQGPIINIILSQESLEAGSLIDQIQQAPPQIVQFGNLGSPEVLLALFGLVLMVGLSVRKINGAILIAILVTSGLGLALGVSPMPDAFYSLDLDLSPTFLQLDLAGIFGGENVGVGTAILEILTLMIAFTMVDLFDTIGTLYGTASKGGFLDEKGKLPRMKFALLADAIATTAGSLLGTSTTTTYIESSTGIAAGGRTGLTAVVVAVLFLICVIFAPLAGMIPAYATSPALIMVGVYMLGSIRKVNLDDLEEAIPAFFVLTLMPFTYSIASGIGVGLIFYTLIKLIKGDVKSLNPVVAFIAILFVIKFIFT